jgi:hypothetical protein
MRINKGEKDVPLQLHNTNAKPRCSVSEWVCFRIRYGSSGKQRRKE